PQIGKGAVAAAGEDGDFADPVRTEFDCGKRIRKLRQEVLVQLFAGEVAVDEKSDVVSFVGKKSASGLQAEAPGEEGVIADFRVQVERKVRPVNRAVRFHK